MKEVKFIMRFMNEKTNFLEKLREESEQREVRNLVEYATVNWVGTEREINNLLRSIIKKLVDVNEVVPFLDLRVTKYKPDLGVALLVEWSSIDDKIPYKKHVSLDDLRDTLILLDDVIENPEKYTKRYELSRILYEQFKIEGRLFKGFSVLDGLFKYKNGYTVDLNDDLGLRDAGSSVVGTLEDDGTFSLDVEIQSELTKDFEVNSDTSSLDVDFSYKGLLPELESVRLENNVKYALKGVKADDVLATIKRVENLVRVRLDNTKGFENSEQ